MLCTWCSAAGRRLTEGDIRGARALHDYCAGDCTCQHRVYPNQVLVPNAPADH